ncbi:g4742 [Coccomyxa elongata]
MSSASQSISDDTVNVQRRKRGPKYNNLWPLALAPLFPGIVIAFRKQPVLRTRLLFGTAALVLVGAHHSGMSTSIGTK